MSSLPLECHLDHVNGGVVLYVRGEIDLWTVDALRLELDPLVRHGKAVVVDLSEVSYLDGAGFRVLAEAARIARTKEQSLYVIPSPIVKRLLGLLRLDDTFIVRESVKDAMESLQAAQ